MPLIGQGTASATDIVECVRNKLRDWPLEDRLTASFTAGGTSMTVNDSTLFGVGRTIEIDDGSQSVYLIRAVSAPNLTVKIHRGSTDANHASGVAIRLEPQFTRQEIEDATAHAVGLLWPEVWDQTTTTLTYSAATHPYYAWPSDMLNLISATQKNDNTPPAYFALGTVNAPRVSEVPGLPAADFASGRALHFPDGWQFQQAGDTVLITYARKVTTSTISTGLMADTVCWGTVAHLLTSKGVERAQPFRPSDPGVSGPTIPHVSSREAKDYYRMGKMRLHAELNQTYRKAESWRRGSVGVG